MRSPALAAPLRTKYGFLPSDSDSDPKGKLTHPQTGREAWIHGVPSPAFTCCLPASTGYDTGSRLMIRIPMPDWISLQEPPHRTSRPVGLLTRAAPFLTCSSSLRTKLAARPTRMGLTRLGWLPPRPAAPYGPGLRPREHQPGRGKWASLMQSHWTQYHHQGNRRAGRLCQNYRGPPGLTFTGY